MQEAKYLKKKKTNYSTFAGDITHYLSYAENSGTVLLTYITRTK